MIYAFGNSHVSIFSGTDIMVPTWPNRSIDKIPWFKTFRLGAVTAYQAVKHLDKIYEIMDEVGFDKRKDILLFVFGEVDIRAHIMEQALKQNRHMDHITYEVVDRYWEAISKAHKKFKVAVFGCIAGFKMKPGGQEPPWPNFGTCRERNIITKNFNDGLKIRCDNADIPFISVFEEMLFADGETDTKYLDKLGAGCHATTRLLPLILWKFRDAGLIPWEEPIVEWENWGK